VSRDLLVKFWDPLNISKTTEATNIYGVQMISRSTTQNAKLRDNRDVA